MTENLVGKDSVTVDLLSLMKFACPSLRYGQAGSFARYPVSLEITTQAVETVQLSRNFQSPFTSLNTSTRPSNLQPRILSSSLQNNVSCS